MRYGCVIVFLAVAVAVPVQAQVFKCKTPKGETVFSDTACDKGATFEKVRPSEHVSKEEYDQARSVHSRNTSQLRQIEASNAAYNRSVTRQQNIAAITAVEPVALEPQAPPAKKTRRTSTVDAEPRGIIDARTGTYMPSIGGGNYIDPRNGTFMQGVAGGVINSRTGQFSPTTR